MTYNYSSGISKERSLVAIVAFILTLMLTISSLVSWQAGAKAEKSGTQVPGHARSSDSDSDGYPDAGVWVNGHYTALYAYDADNWYWDLGDGQPTRGTVDSVDKLDQATLTTCDYVINYRADFGGDAYMNQGSIHNNINCTGEEKGTYNSLIVSEEDPRYTGDPARVVPGWGEGWEYVVDTWSGVGNVANPAKHQD